MVGAEKASAPRSYPPIRPTLVLGLGGTGARTLRALHTRLASYFLADPDSQEDDLTRFLERGPIRLLGLDTTASTDAGRIGITHINLGDFNITRFLRHVRSSNFREAFAWFPDAISNAGHISRGAGGLRPIGRLAYKRKQEHVRSWIGKLLDQLRDVDLSMEMVVEWLRVLTTSEGIDIHVVSSVCGGTGAGILLDVCYDVRELLGERPGRVIGHLVLPEAFSSEAVDMDILKANAYMMLAELDHFMCQGGWHSRHLNGHEQSEAGTPFDYCNLLSQNSKKGVTLSIARQTQIVAEAIAFHAIHPSGNLIDEQLINLQTQVLARADQDGMACAYSSYNLHRVAVPEGIVASVSSSLVDQVCKHLWKEGQEPDVPPETIRNLLESFDLLKSTGDILMLTGSPMWLDSDQSDAAQFAMLQQFEQDQRDTARAKIEAWSERVLGPESGFSNALEGSLKEHIRNPDHGFPSALLFLKLVQSKLQARVNDMQSESQVAVNLDEKRARAVNRGGKRGVQESLQSNRDAYEKAVTQQLCRELSLDIRNTIQTLLTKFVKPVLNDINQVRENALNMAGPERMDAAFEQIEDLEESGDYITNGFSSCPISRQAMSEFLEKRAEGINRSVASELTGGGDAASSRDKGLYGFKWKLLENSIERALKRTPRKATFDYIVEVLRLNQTQATVYLRELSKITTPMWELSDAFPVDSFVRTFGIISGQDEGTLKSIKDALEDKAMASRWNVPPYEFLVYRAAHGASIPAMVCVEGYWQALNKKLSRDSCVKNDWGIECFALDRAWPIPELVLPELQAQELFAQATLLKEVTRDEQRRVYVFANEVGKVCEEVRTRTEAFRQYANRYLRSRVNRSRAISDHYADVLDFDRKRVEAHGDKLEELEKQLAEEIGKLEKELEIFASEDGDSFEDQAVIHDQLERLRTESNQIAQERMALKRVWRRMLVW